MILVAKQGASKKILTSADINLVGAEKI